MEAEKITLKSIANNIYPDWQLNDWFYWPPNVFALISIVFKTTGAYKYIVSSEIDTDFETGAKWENYEWQGNIEKDHNKWLIHINDSILNKSNGIFFIEETIYLMNDFNFLNEYWDSISMNDLRNVCAISKLNTNVINTDNIKKFVESLVTIYAISDSASRGLGLVGLNIKSDYKNLKLYQCYANILLNNTGSLSTLPKFHGVVLPKMRTPQTGLTIRSMSHHLTFHASEVEVMWRTLPWSNNNKQSLNILSVPFPKKIDESNFEVVNDRFSSSRFFKCKSGNNEDKENVKEFLEGLIDEIIIRAKANCPIDIIVFPEMSLNEISYLYFLKELNNRILKDHENAKIDEKHKCNHFSFYPIIIAGILNEHEEQNGGSKQKPFINQVRIASYFAGKWYDIKQHKHHRWHLDKSQVKQYQLEGLFPTDREWFEYCAVGQRRLTILAPNGWLALTSLICEDLAQQEPVAEVIRGIGPTLLFALLSDGPQLTNRWSARYANVLADDPGTAVLSLSSEGMVRRSNRENPEKNTILQKSELIVGLWKDMIRGYKTISLLEGYDAILFTISANYKEEFTLDGRSDYTNASVFEMSTITPIQVKINNSKKKQRQTPNTKLGQWDDIRDISAFIYSLDAVIDLRFKNEFDAIKCIFSLLNNARNNHIKTDNSSFEYIKPKANIKIFAELDYSVQKSWLEPHLIGIEAKIEDSRDSYTDVINAVKELENICNKIPNKIFSGENEYFKKIIKICKENLKNLKMKDDRMVLMVNLATLENLYSKLSNFRSKDVNKITVRESLNMRAEIDSIRSQYNLLRI